MTSNKKLGMFKKLGLCVSKVLNGVALSEERVRAQVTKTQLPDRKGTVVVKHWPENYY